MSSSITQGDAPLVVTWIDKSFDVDGDDLVVSLGSDPPSSSKTEFEVPGGGGSENGTTYYTSDTETWTFYSPGTYTVMLTVSDGRLNATDSVTIHVTGKVAYTDLVMQSTANVTSTCSICSGSTLGTATAAGGEGCRGFVTRANQTDCAWFKLKPEWAGYLFYANASNNADVDVEMRNDCQVGTGSSIHYIHDGYESAKIPKGAGCAVLWTFKSAPSEIEFRIHAIRQP